MSVSITIELARTFTVAASVETTFELLADVPRSASHFPKVDKLEEIEPGRFHWTLRKTGVDKYALQTVYACDYQSDAGKRQVIWTPVPEVGNAVVEGAWVVQETDEPGKGAECHFRSHAVMELPIPKLLKMAVAPVVKHEFNSMVDHYIENLKSALNG